MQRKEENESISRGREYINRERVYGGHTKLKGKISIR